MLVLLFTDIESSSRLWEEHTTVMTGTIARHDEILLELVSSHGGRITGHTSGGITQASALPDQATPPGKVFALSDLESWPLSSRTPLSRSRLYFSGLSTWYGRSPRPASWLQRRRQLRQGNFGYRKHHNRQTYTITWTSTAGVGNVKIEYSTDGGTTYSTVIESTSNTGSYDWLVPGTPSGSCLVRVSSDTPVVVGATSRTFSIVSCCLASIRTTPSASSAAGMRHIPQSTTSPMLRPFGPGSSCCPRSSRPLTAGGGGCVAGGGI